MINLILALALLPSAALATPLTWQDVKNMALKENPSLRSASLLEQAASSQAKSSLGRFAPTLTLNGARRRSSITSAGTEAIDRRGAYGLTASLNLFAGFSTIADWQQNRARADEATADKDLTSADLRYQLRKAYFEVSYQQVRIRLFERIFKRLEQNQKLISLKYESGTEAQWNVQKTGSDAEFAAYNLKAAQLDLITAQDKLSQLLQIDKLPNPEVEDPKPEHITPINVDAEALSREHPAVKKSVAYADRQGRLRTAARAAFFPTIDLSYTRGRENPYVGDRLGLDQNAMALTAQWNIFSGFADYFNVQAANIRYDSADQGQIAEQRRVLNDIRTSVNNLKNGIDRLPSARSQRIAAEERSRTVSAQYRAGLKTYIDWESSESQLIETQQTELSALRNALYALAEAERATGKTLEQP
jgi:adhesin transport system outer membrane protein